MHSKRFQTILQVFTRISAQYQVGNQWLPQIKNHPNPKTPHRPLRIGYISPDFRRHSVSAFIKPVIQHHDRSRVEVFCYGEVSKPDGITEEIINICDAWRSTVGMSDIEVVELIKSDRIDILVVLAGHTVGNRLVVLGMKPAPIQATYLGYFATTGLPTIDYWITDEVLHPPLILRKKPGKQFGVYPGAMSVMNH